MYCTNSTPGVWCAEIGSCLYPLTIVDTRDFPEIQNPSHEIVTHFEDLCRDEKHRKVTFQPRVLIKPQK